MNLRIRNVVLQMTVIITVFSSCYPVDDLTVEDLDVAGTLYDKSYYPATPGSEINKFQDLQTFTIIDTIIHIVAVGEGDQLSRTNDAFVIEQVRLNMLKVGFTEVTDTTVEKSDVVITLAAMSSENEVYTWYPCWGWYWGYGGSTYSYSGRGYKSYNYDYYYPWYSYSTYYTYLSGTLIVEMVDANRVDINVELLPVIWAGLVNGVLEGTQSEMKNRLASGIDQCFNQSPYLLKY